VGGRRWKRYVAIGDSTTEGMDDPDGRGGYRGWADRLAEHIASVHNGLEYANLAIRGKTTAEIHEEQLGAALSMEPDLMTIVAGMNDILKPSFNATEIADRIATMVTEAAAAGATVLTFTLPDPTPNLPFTARLQPRVAALNRQIARLATETGAIVVDVASYPHASDPRLWSEDRLHGNTAGHAKVAHALAWGLQLPGFDDSWRAPLPPATPPPRVDLMLAEVAWVRQHAMPWLWRNATGRSAGDGVEPKRPVPQPLCLA
jgi:lysophospholipase L1-like esterase